MNKQKWNVTDSRYVFKDKWISVRSDDCITSTGVNISPYYVFEFTDFVHTLAFDDSDHAILVRQYRHGYNGFTLELPGGFVDAGETDIKAAAARELKEETGYTDGLLNHIITLSPDPGRYSNRVHLILAENVILGAAAPEPTEDIEVVLVPRGQLTALACSGEITNASHVGFILLSMARSITQKNMK